MDIRNSGPGRHIPITYRDCAERRPRYVDSLINLNLRLPCSHWHERGRPILVKDAGTLADDLILWHQLLWQFKNDNAVWWVVGTPGLTMKQVATRFTWLWVYHGVSLYPRIVSVMNVHGRSQASFILALVIVTLHTMSETARRVMEHAVVRRM